MDELLTGFKPIVDENSKVLILGSMPSVASLRAGQYYAHPQNRFFKIMFAMLGEEYSTDYGKRIRLLKNHRIALWDSVYSCNRIGSLDSAIKKATPNDVVGLLSVYPGIKMVFTNGKKSDEVFAKFNANLDRICLPSTSPANAAYSLDRLCKIWSENILPYIT